MDSKSSEGATGILKQERVGITFMLAEPLQRGT
jgi:hypothetical protein